MNSLYIKDFRYGLDTRKSELTQRPGALADLVNGFINQGGEIENRKAFIRTARVTGTFGLQSTSAGLFTFGSTDLSASHPVNVGTVAIPKYVYFQRLQHPARLLAMPEAYDAAKHDMIKVVFSTDYRRQAFVVATFTDGTSWAYFNGLLLNDFVDGLILAYLVNNTTKISTTIAAMVDRQTNYSAVSVGSVTTITGPLGQPYATNVIDNAVAGALAALKSSDPTDGVLARQAVGSFTIVAGSVNPGTNKINSVMVNGVTITNAAVDYTTTNETTASLIAASINTNVSAPEYSATAVGAVVVISASLAGVAPNTFVVKVNAAGDVCVGKSQWQIFSDSGTAFTISDITAGNVSIIGALVGTFSGTPTSFTAAIAVAINANTVTGTAHGFLANASGSILTISQAVTQSSDADIVVLFNQSNTRPGTNGVFELGVPTGGGNGGGGLTVSIFAIETGHFMVNRSYIFTKWTVSAVITGGVLPYLTTKWHLPEGNSNTYPLSNTSAIVSGYQAMPLTWCEVTDSAGITARSNNLP